MPDVIVTLSDEEFSDLEALAEQQLKDVPDCAQDVLVKGVASELDSSTAQARNRRASAFANAFVRTTKVLNAGGYPARERRNL